MSNTRKPIKQLVAHHVDGDKSHTDEAVLTAVLGGLCTAGNAIFGDGVMSVMPSHGDDDMCKVWLDSVSKDEQRIREKGGRFVVITAQVYSNFEMEAELKSRMTDAARRQLEN